MSARSKFLLALLALVLSLGWAASVGAAPQAKLWPRWQASDPRSTLRVDHSAWAAFLQKYLVVTPADAPNLVRYRSVSAADKQALTGYLAALAAVPVATLNRAEQKAYWINLYNALTVKTILDHYPVTSIRDIKSGWFRSGPWDLKLIQVDGVELSLNDIEHRILRPIWRDNRIHFAVNCASLGCPSLQPEPFTAGNNERLLDQGASDYIHSPRGVRFEGNTLTLSSIFDWYQVDFGGSQAALLSYLETPAAPELAARLKAFAGSIEYGYDWQLNGK
jgi:Protein of unknown function, DUF547